MRRHAGVCIHVWPIPSAGSSIEGWCWKWVSFTMGWCTAEGRRSLESGGPFALDAMLANGGLLVQCVCKVHVCMCSVQCMCVTYVAYMPCMCSVRAGPIRVPD